MRIKIWVNKKVEAYVKALWPEKKVMYNYTDDSSHMRDENRFIQISTPIDDPYLHYEIINNHIELHFEYSDSKDEGVTAPTNQELVDYLERVSETDNNYEWSYWGECSVKCVQLGSINEGDMLEKLKTMIEYFDPKIKDFINRNNNEQKLISLKVDNTLLPTQNVDMKILTLKDVLARNLHIPDYQRIYCWEEKNVKCLLEDLNVHLSQTIDIIPYRLGSIILHFHDGIYDIIDGQQRLVTLSLLLNCLGQESCLMSQCFEDSKAQSYVAYNKYFIENYIRKHVSEKNKFVSALLQRIEFSVLMLNNSSLDLAYTFFSNENSRGVTLTDYDLLKAHHLRFIPEYQERQSYKAAEVWNAMVKKGQENVTDSNSTPEYDRMLDTYLFNMRQWMKMRSPETNDNDRHIKNEYEAALIMPELPPFCENFYFNEPIQGGTHFFSFVEIHLAKYEQFVKTAEYITVHNTFTTYGSSIWYRNVIEALMFGYYEKFGEHCLADTTVLILRLILQHRYETNRAQRLGISKYVSEKGVMLMIDRATSPTFFLAEMFDVVRDFPVKYMQEMEPVQRSMRKKVLECREKIRQNIYVESIKNMKL